MLRGEVPTDRWTKAMDISLILYAEHEYNASTFTARVIASTRADLHSAITGAIGALKGPQHGGANERVMEVAPGSWLGTKRRAVGAQRLCQQEAGHRGFGHRVYKKGDPRAKYLKTLCQELAAETGHQELEKIAETIETIVTGEKGLPPNLDWPSARLYHYMGLPINLYTPLFVVSRVSGWSAHVIEQSDNNRLIRPRARYIGQASRNWSPVEKR